MNIIEITEIVEENDLTREHMPSMSMGMIITKDQLIEAVRIIIEIMNILLNKRTQSLSHIIKIIKPMKKNNKIMIWSSKIIKYYNRFNFIN